MPRHPATLAAALLLVLPAVAAADPVTQKVAVKGPATVQLAAHDGDIEVKVGGKGEISVTADVDADSPVGKLVLKSKGDQVDVKGGPGVEDIVLTVPTGTKLSLSGISGDIKVGAIDGDVKIRATSGDVSVAGARAADIVTVSGDVRVAHVSGAVRLRTVSGDSVVTTTGSAPTLDFETTSGELAWSGVCGKGCSLNLRSLSGDLSLKLGKTSSFALDLEAFSGELDDHLGLTVDKRSGGDDSDPGAGASVEAHLGKSEGAIRASLFSGDLVLAR